MPATWGYHPDEVAGILVQDVMQAQCDTCGELLAVAGQSTHAVKRVLDDRRNHRTKLRLPRPLKDFIGLSLSQAGADATQHELFMRALFNVCLDEGAKVVAVLVKNAADPVLERPADAGVNVSMSPQVLGLVADVQHTTGWNRARSYDD